MAKIIEREKAQNLRRSGVSINSIADKLKVSKSTVSHWCRDIILSESAIQKIIKSSERKSTVGILRYTESLRAERQKRVLFDRKKGSFLLGKLSERDILWPPSGLG